jgi:hypothetical protein
MTTQKIGNLDVLAGENGTGRVMVSGCTPRAEARLDSLSTLHLRFRDPIEFHLLDYELGPIAQPG